MAKRNTKTESRHVSSLSFVGPRTGEHLSDAGYRHASDLRQASRAELRAVRQVGDETIRRVVEWRGGEA